MLTKAEKKYLATLGTKKGRRQNNQFLAEGVRLLEESLRHDFLPRKVFFAPSLLNPRGEDLIGEMARRRVPNLSVAAVDIGQIADTETSQGVVALFDIPEYEAADLSGRGTDFLLLLDNIADPGNVGTLLRSALAFGFGGVIFHGESVEPYNPKVVRSSAGALFGLPLVQMNGHQIEDLKKGSQAFLLAADISGEELTTQRIQMLAGKTIILAIGSESEGLSREISDLTDRRFRVVHESRVESLNAAVAGSIIMNELYRIRKSP